MILSSDFVEAGCSFLGSIIHETFLIVVTEEGIGLLPSRRSMKIVRYVYRFPKPVKVRFQKVLCCVRMYGGEHKR